MSGFCEICGHPKGPSSVDDAKAFSHIRCGCGCHARDVSTIVHAAAMSSRADQQPEIPDEDSWPVVAVERQPNGHLGVKLTFPGFQLGVDELAFNIEPKRARRLRDQLSAHLGMVGLG